MSSPRIAVVLLSAVLALGCGAHCLALATTMESGHACCPGDDADPQLSAEADCSPVGTPFALDVELASVATVRLEAPRATEPLWAAERPERPPDILRTTNVLRL